MKPIMSRPGMHANFYMQYETKPGCTDNFPINLLCDLKVSPVDFMGSNTANKDSIWDILNTFQTSGIPVGQRFVERINDVGSPYYLLTFTLDLSLMNYICDNFHGREDVTLESLKSSKVRFGEDIKIFTTNIMQQDLLEGAIEKMLETYSKCFGKDPSHYTIVVNTEIGSAADTCLQIKINYNGPERSIFA